MILVLLTIVLVLAFLPAISYGQNQNGNPHPYPKNLSSDVSRGVSRDLQIVASGSNVFVIWVDQGMSKTSLYFKKSSDSGNSFEPAIRINRGFGYNILSPAIAIFGNDVYLSWVYAAGDQSDVYLAVSNDGGKKFSMPKNLSANEGNSVAPILVVHKKAVFVAWLDDSSRGYSNYGVLFAKSSNDGMGFSMPVAISSPGSRALDVSLVGTDTNNVFLSWIETLADTIEKGGPQESEILFRSSSDGGITFGEPIVLSDSPGFPSSLLMSGSSDRSNSYVDVLWKDISESGDEILFRESADAGVHFGDITRIKGYLAQTLTMADSITPYHRVDIAWNTCDETDDDLHGAQNSDEFICNVYFSSMAINQTKLGVVPVTSDGRSEQPLLYSSGGNVTLLWTRSSAEPSDKKDLGWISYGPDGRMDNSTVYQLDVIEKPALATCGSGLCMAWLDGLNVKFLPQLAPT